VSWYRRWGPPPQRLRVLKANGDWDRCSGDCHQASARYASYHFFTRSLLPLQRDVVLTRMRQPVYNLALCTDVS